MKTPNLPSNNSLFALVTVGLFAMALYTAAPLAAQTTIITEDTIIAGGTTLAVGQSLTYTVNDNKTLTLTGSAGAPVFTTIANTSLTIGPSTAGGSGRTTISGITGAQAMVLVASSTASLANVLMQGNTGAIRGGAIAMSGGVLNIQNGEFRNNSANAGGALDVNGGGIIATLYNVLFDGNRAVGNNQGGAAAVSNGANLTAIDTVFTNNRALQTSGVGGSANLGGAIFVNQSASTLTFILTGSNGVKDYRYTGNYALTSGTVAMASAGGFLYMNANVSNRNITFDVWEGIALTIGEAAAGTDRNYDTIAGGAATTRLVKQGPGDLVLNADNSYFVGSTTVAAGRLLLGNNEAKYASPAPAGISVLANATLGGAGTFIATTFNSAGQSIIQVGIDNATQAQTLTLNGALTLGDAAQIKFDLYNNNQADLLVANTLTWTSGVNHYINLGALATGTFTLAKANTMNIIGGLILQVNGAAAAPARYSGGLTTTATSILLTGTLYSLSGTWAGASGALWRNSGTGWGTGTTDVSFQNGDNVTFLAGGTVAVAPNGVTASRMNVGGSGTLTFAGEGSITTDGLSAQPGSATLASTDGKLVKDGAGTLAFANTGTNRFTGGVDIKGGAISIDNASQLDASGTSIRFENTGTLVARAGISGTLAAAIELAGAATVAALEVSNAADSFAMSGALRGASGIFAKSGSGTLTLTGNSGLFTGTTRVDAGALMLAGANLGGSTILTATGMLGGTGTVAKLTTTGGAVIQVGAPGATTPDLLAFNTLELAANTVLKLTLVSGDADPASSVNSRLTAGTLAFAGAGVTGSSMVFNLNSFLVGNYDIASFTNYDAVALADFDKANILLSGRARTQREFAEITVNSGTLFLALDKASETITWTGAQGSMWTSGTSWTKSGTGMEFADGDTVLFNSTDIAGNRDITIEGTEVTASGMEVSGDGSYRFSGGAIVLDAANAGGDLKGVATGTLVMNGSGTLTLANDGINDFRHGVVLQNGTIELASAGALGTSHVNVTGADATLLVSFADMDLQNTTGIADGSTLNLDTQDNNTVLSGTIMGASAGAGVLVKKGAGTLSLASTGLIDVATLNIDKGALSVTPATTIRATTFNLGPNATLLASGTGVSVPTINAANFNHAGVIRIGRAVTSSTTTPFGTLNITGNYHAQAGSQLFIEIGTQGSVVVSDKLVIGGIFSGTLNVDVTQREYMRTNANWSWEPIVCGSIDPNAEITSNEVELAGLATNRILTIDRATGTITWQNVPPPELPAVAALDISAMLIGRVAVDAISRQLTVLRDNRVAHHFDVWAAGMYHDNTVGSGIYDGAKARTYGMQAGAGWNYFCDEKRVLSFGFFADALTADMDQPGGTASTRAESKGVGMYGTFASGVWYMDMSVRGSEENYRVSVPRKPEFATDGSSMAGSIATGLSFKGDFGRKESDFYWEPQLQLTWQRHRIGDATDHAARVYEIDRFDSLQGRAGVRFWQDIPMGKKSLGTFWVRVSYLEEFNGESVTRVTSDAENPEYANDFGGPGWMLDGGVRARFGDHTMLSLEAAWLGDKPTRGVTLNASLTIAW